MIIACSASSAQSSLSSLLSELDDVYAIGYMQDFSETFVTGFHTAQYSWPIKEDDFYFQLGLDLNRVTVPRESWRFRANAPDGQAELDLPTLLGDNEPVSYQDDEGRSYDFPGGLALDNVLIASPQLRIGSLLGIDVGVRYANYDYGQLLGDIKVLGLNARYSLGESSISERLAMSISYDYSRIQTLDVYESVNHSVRLLAGYRSDVIFIHAHGGFLLSQGELSLSRADSISIVNLNRYTSPLVGAGLGVKVWKIVIHGEYTIVPLSSIGLSINLHL